MKTAYRQAFPIMFLLFSACAAPSDASQAIVEYVQALVEKDVVAATAGSCLDWEESASAEASSFEAVGVTLEGLTCAISEEDVQSALVKCEGKIIADYGGELLDINLAQRTYVAVIEQGEWKMCGYASE